MVNIDITLTHLVMMVSHQGGRWLVGLLITIFRYFSIPWPVGSAKGDPMISSSAEMISSISKL